MTTTPLDPRSRVLDAARDAVRVRMRADADLLAAAAEWALLHPVAEAEDAAGWTFGEDLIPLAGEGAPLVAEFAPAELAAALGWSTETVQDLMGDTLELCSRLPRIYRDVQALHLPVPLARFLAEQTRDLSRDAARLVDQMLRGGGKLTRRFIRRVVDEVRPHEDPDRAAAEEQNALAARRVEVRPGRTPATGDVEMTLDTPDVAAFDGVVSRMADRLKELGDIDDLDVRPGRAVGILADPAAALALLNSDPEPPTSKPGGQVDLVLHLYLATPGHGPRRWAGPGTRWRSVKGLGRGGRRRWLPIGACGRRAAPAPPPRCRCRPAIGTTLRAADHNLAPLCRRHHRAKTHGRWTYRRLPNGTYRWTTPTGRIIDTPPARRS